MCGPLRARDPNPSPSLRLRFRPAVHAATELAGMSQVRALCRAVCAAGKSRRAKPARSLLEHVHAAPRPALARSPSSPSLTLARCISAPSLQPCTLSRSACLTSPPLPPLPTLRPSARCIKPVGPQNVIPRDDHYIYEIARATRPFAGLRALPYREQGRGDA